MNLTVDCVTYAFKIHRDVMIGKAQYLQIIPFQNRIAFRIVIPALLCIMLGAIQFDH